MKNEIPAEFASMLYLAGVDEVGRGPLAGPVVAAAIILPPGFAAEGLADSKRVSASNRLRLAHVITASAATGIGFVPAAEIDRLNIRHASLLAMQRAIFALPIMPEGALIDGRDIPPGLICPARAIVRGDSTILAIAAASIVAKVARDRMMAFADQVYPGYGFANHAGYPTKTHRAAILRSGLCPLHRRTFGPCKVVDAIPSPPEAFENGTMGRSGA